jgi:hypothetical protein
MTAHKHGGWRRPEHALGNLTPRSTIGQHDTIAIFPKPAAPRTSWWTTARSREEFDRLVEARWNPRRQIEARG